MTRTPMKNAGEIQDSTDLQPDDSLLASVNGVARRVSPEEVSYWIVAGGIIGPAATKVDFEAQYTGDGSTATFLLPTTPAGQKSNIDVYVNRTRVPSDEYTLSGLNITLDDVPSNGADISIKVKVFSANGTSGDFPALSMNGARVPVTVATRAGAVTHAVAFGGGYPDGTRISWGDGLEIYKSAGATAISDIPDWLPFGEVCPEHFADNATPGTTDMTAAIQAAIDYQESKPWGIVHFKAAAYLISATLTVQSGYITLRGSGVTTVITRANGDFGDSLYIAAADPTAATLLYIDLLDIKFDSTVEVNSGALVHIAETAYMNISNVTIENGFVGLRLRGLRASQIDNLFIRSGQYFTGTKVGSRLLLMEDSPRVGSAYENVEVFFDTFNFTQNNAGASTVEYGAELKEGDGVWFSNGHIRGGALAQCWLNAAGSPQLTGYHFSNVWFDGNTAKNLLFSGAGTLPSTLHTFANCTFTAATTYAVHVASGADVGTLTFSGGETAYTTGAQAWRFDEGGLISISGHTFASIDAVASGSCILFGPNVGKAVVSGGAIEFISIPVGSAYYGVAATGTATRLNVSGVDFTGFTESLSRPIFLTSPETIPFTSSGCSTDHPSGYVAGNPQFGEELNIADDTAVSTSIGEVRGGILAVSLKLNSTASGLMAFETEGTASASLIAGGATLAVTTGALTGLTGADTKFTVSVDDAGTLYFENRTGVTRSVVWRVISRDLFQ